MVSSQLFSKPKTYLITGGAGFIGSHISETLIQQGYRVLVIDNLSTGSLANISHLLDHPNFHFAYASIADDVVLDRLMSEADVAIHLAAAVGVKLIVEQPVHTIETNVMGMESVLQAAIRYRVKTVIASTSEVYGKGNKVPFTEDDDVVLGPTCRSRWSYAATKMVDEFLALAYYHEKGLPVVIARLFNTVGPRQTGQYGMVIPRFVQQALKGENLSVYGDGKQSRCFLHVSDAVKALLKLAECNEAIGEVFNVGSTEEISIVELARKVITLTRQKNKESQSDIDFVPYGQAYAPGFEDMQRRVPDNTKIQQYVNWQPTKILEEILHDVLVSFTDSEHLVPQK
ncbi:GDP-mannose 4,6-dehydratase [Spirulina sp. 06S082]|uniref:GDP-mannose 4,6-dehydratase n=1 Tax=Spirulina sp. 06S082 TaxID=3110248 RepID=UPI002B214D52|nr:GDP-mannose 4,6-dehydratase [Spirulina sp. 06S082]MEA5471190.1 GDP-mannose 4,6-dehydratase [Spirulina sp. 06S082]